MRFLLAILILVGAISAQAATRISALITLTNTPSTNFSLTVNGDARYWGTNLSVTNILVTNTIQASATNLFRHLAGYPFAGPVVIAQPATNQVSILGIPSQAMAVSFASNWAAVSYTTQQVGSLLAVRVPISGEYAATNRTNIATWLMQGINDYSGSAFDGTALALANFVGRTNGQTVTGNITFEGTNVFTNAPNLYNAKLTNSRLDQATIDTSSNVTLRGTVLVSAATITNALIQGGGITNTLRNQLTTLVVSNIYAPNAAYLYALTATNTVNRGSALQSYSNDVSNLKIGLSANELGSATYLVAVGYSASATNDASAFGAGATAGGTRSVAVGYSSSASDTYGIALGQNANSSAQYGVAIGANAAASGVHSLALGALSSATHQNSFAIGKSAATTADFQVAIGSSTIGASFPGNAYFAGALGVGASWGVALPTSFAGGIAMTNGTSASADPTNGVVFNSASGEWVYRTSKAGEGSGRVNRVHNYGAETNGSGTDYTLTASTALVDFGGVDPDITLPSAGTYLIQAIVTATAGGTANDSYVFKLYNQTGAADIANSSKSVTATPASQKFQVFISSIFTVTAGDRIQLYGHNSTAARGTVNSTETKLIYIRLF